MGMTASDPTAHTGPEHTDSGAHMGAGDTDRAAPMGAEHTAPIAHTGPEHTGPAVPMGPEHTLLAVDAGNSKTDVAVVAGDGSVLATARGGGFRPPSSASGRRWTRSPTPSAGPSPRRASPPSAMSPRASPTPICPWRRSSWPPRCTRAWATTVEVRNDTFAILRAGVEEPRGVAVVCGAGINCVGMRPDGRVARFPALGRISGDWGGGWGLSEEALWHAARAEDGRGAPTDLARALPAHFGLSTMYALIEALHLGHIEDVRRHELAPVLFATAADGDPVARALVDRLADEVVSMAVVALTRLDLLGEEAPVLLGGGVLAARHPQLDDRVRELLAERAPKAVPRVVTARPVLGAALLGLDHQGAPAAAHARVREFYERV